MTKAFLPHRIIFDSSAIIKIHKNFRDKFSLFVYNLAYINTNSAQHKKKHVIISKASFDLITTKLQPMLSPHEFNFLAPAVRPQTEPPEIEQMSDEINRIWEYAVYVSAETPFKTTIFTEPERIPAYESYRTKDKKENIFIRGHEACFDLIDTYIDLCRESKSS